MNKLLSFFLFFLFLQCCKNKVEYGVIQNMETPNHKNNFEAIRLGTKEFHLDEETVNLIDYLQYIDSLDFLTFLNDHNKSICFYDNNSAEYLYRINLENLRNQICGYYWDNGNIFAYSYNSGILFSIDSSNNVKSKYLMSNASKGNKDMIYPAPYLQSLAPLKKYDNKILSVGFVTGETSFETTNNRTVVTIFDLDDSSISNVVNYPEIYTLYNWAGGFTYRMPSYDLVNESIIINFPACHYLIKYSLATGIQSNHYAGGSTIEYIKSFPFSKNKTIDENRAWVWYMNNPSYEGVLYDKYREQYYRISRLPIRDYNVKERGNRKPIVIIILDANLNYIGEVNLPPDVYFLPGNCYVSKEGFNIQVLTEDEDKLTFYLYKFSSNEL